MDDERMTMDRLQQRWWDEAMEKCILNVGALTEYEHEFVIKMAQADVDGKELGVRHRPTKKQFGFLRQIASQHP